MSDDDKVIRFPGPMRKPGEAAPAAKNPDAGEREPLQGPTGKPTKGDVPGTDGLTEDQRKAIQVILSGMPFVFVGIKPTDRGADFYTALHGDAADLRNAQPHLTSVIDRALGRRGI